MADALHSQSPQDGNEARSAACGAPVQPDISHSSSILSPGDILPPTAETSSSRFLQPPTFSFTPATPSPPLPTPHEGIEDAVIQGLLSGGVNSLNSPPLGKDASIEPDPLSLPGVLEGIQKVDSGSTNAELPDMSENSLDTFSSIVNSTSLNFREISDCLEHPGDIPVSSATLMDSQNRNETPSKDVENSPTVPLIDSLEKQVDRTSEPMSDLMNANNEVQKAVDPPLASPLAKEFDGGGWKHSFASGEGTNCSNGVVQDSKTNSVGHTFLQPEDPVVEPVCSELGGKELPSPLSEFRAEFAMESRPENCLGSGGSNSENALLNLLPSEMQNSSEDSLSLPNSTVVDPLKDIVANPLLVCKDVNMTDTAEKEKYLCDGAVAADLASLTENTDLLSQIENTSTTSETEAMDVDEANEAEKFSELEKTFEGMDEVRDKSEVQSAKENSLPETSLPESSPPETSLLESSLPEFAMSKGGSDKTEGSDGKEVSGVTRKVSSVLLNDSDEPLQPVTIGGSLQPLEEVQEASILNDPSFTADLSLIDSSADEADSIGGLVINSVIGAADGVADFPPDDEMEVERQLTDISSSAPRVNQGSCEVDSSEDVEPSAKRRKLENGEKEDDKIDDPKSVVFKVLPVKNGHGLWDSLKLKEVLLSKGTIHLRIHTSASEFGNFEPEKCEIEVDFTCIMVSALEEACDSPLGNAVPDPDSCDPLAIVANAGAVESNSPPHYPRPFGAQTRGRSTALQPAMPRPPYRHLQSPPHAYNKNEVLGLPQGIEFEEPQNATEWSGAGSRRVTPLVHAEPRQASWARTPLLPQPSTSVQLDSGKKMDQVDSEKGPNRKEKEVEEEEEVGRKVCEHCGWVFSKLVYPYHVRTHKPWLKCKLCSFTTKSCDRFKAHEEAHKEGKLAVVCKLCRGQYLNETTLKVHCRRVHGIIRCRDCSDGFPSEAAYASHRDEVHNDPTLKIKCNSPCESRGLLPVDSQHLKRSEYVCQLCNKESRNKFQLKIHIAQHLGVSSADISDEFLAGQGMKHFQNKELLISLKQSRKKKTHAVLNALVKSKTIEQEPALEVDGSSGLVGADILDASDGRRTLYPLPDPLAETSIKEIPFVSVIKEEPDTCAPHVQNFENNPSEIYDDTGSMSQIQDNVTGEQILAEENLQQEEFQSSSTCPECKESFPNVKELVTHCKQAHKKPEETLNRVRKDQEKCTASKPSSSMRRDSKAPGLCKNPRTQQEHTPIKPTSSMEDISKLQEVFRNPTSAQNAQIERELLDPPEDPLGKELPVATVIKEEPVDLSAATAEVYDLSSQSTHCDVDTFVGSGMMEETQMMSSLSSTYIHDVFAGYSVIDDNFKMEKIRMSRERKPKVEIYCNECPEVFFSPSTLHKHQERHRREDLRKCFTCPECDLTFLAAVKLVRHFKVAHKEKFRCRYKCALLFESKEEVLKHYQEFHKVATAFACPYCGLEYQFNGFLLNHLERCTKCPPDKRPSHVCGNCEAVLKSRRDYNLHKCSSLKDSENISEDKRRAQPLEVIFIEPSTTKDLIPQHPYSCKFCNHKFEEMEAATEHCFSSHLDSLKKMSTERHACKVCKKKMLSELELCRHLMSHYLGSGRWDDLLPRNLMETVYAMYGKNYCWICQAIIQEDVSQHLLQRNKNISLALAYYKETTVTVPFECTHCLKNFQSRAEYWNHVQAHLDEMSLKSDGSDLGGSHYKECSICLLMFAGTEEYHRHLATHAVVVCDGEKKGDVVDSD